MPPLTVLGSGGCVSSAAMVGAGGLDVESEKMSLPLVVGWLWARFGGRVRVVGFCEVIWAREEEERRSSGSEGSVM